ncbi:MAG TPA: hypothetical protein DHV16_03120 [Nitrospiraceae bacterium]|nr:hypothetical protein [Nitrospiraceae bacterium]HCZ11254.1 hypothetical protein [Nitrospiraceae bacterium]
MSGQPCFIADVMLGTLAKWLRILGFDTLRRPPGACLFEF